jgi:hypothetical protein
MKVTNRLSRELTYKRKGFRQFSECMIYLMAGKQTLNIRKKTARIIAISGIIQPKITSSASSIYIANATLDVIHKGEMIDWILIVSLNDPRLAMSDNPERIDMLNRDTTASDSVIIHSWEIINKTHEH